MNLLTFGKFIDSQLGVVNDNCFLVNLNILDVGFQDSHGYEAGLSEKAKSSIVQFNC